MSDKSVIKVSCIQPKDIITTSEIISDHRAKYSGDTSMLPDLGIQNEAVNIDKYLVLSTMICSTMFNRTKILLALDRYNADTYIIYEINDMEFYTLLRFKQFNDAFEFMQVISSIDLAEKEYGMKVNLLSQSMSVIRKIEGADGPRDNKDLVKIRDCIMKGIPNNFPYTGCGIKLMNQLAKQNIIHSDMDKNMITDSLKWV
jgi:hypothetical protein